jgi:hypothetical protein
VTEAVMPDDNPLVISMLMLAAFVLASLAPFAR